jgi:hypothetical protein
VNPSEGESDTVSAETGDLDLNPVMSEIGDSAEQDLASTEAGLPTLGDGEGLGVRSLGGRLRGTTLLRQAGDPLGSVGVRLRRVRRLRGWACDAAGVALEAVRLATLHVSHSPSSTAGGCAALAGRLWTRR